MIWNRRTAYDIINDADPLLSAIKDAFLKLGKSRWHLKLEDWIFKNGSALQRNLSCSTLQSLLSYVLESKMVVELKIE